MKNIPCNVIKDLLPSYLEQICSEETKNLVEEHLNNCSSCKALARTMAKTEFSTDKTDMQEIHYMKKVKRHFMQKNLVLFGLLLLFLFGGTAVALRSMHRDTKVNPQIYYVVLPSLLLAMHCTLSDGTAKKGGKKWQLLLGGLGMIGICHSIILTHACWQWVNRGQYPLEVHKMGPFVSHQLLAAALLQLALFLCSSIISLKTKARYGIPMTIQITGCCIDLSIMFLLYHLSTIEQWGELQIRTILSFIIEGMLTAVVLWLLERRSS